MGSDYDRINRERWSAFPRALVAGLAAGLVAVAFRLALDWAEQFRTESLAAAGQYGVVGYLAAFAAVAVVLGIAVGLVRRFAPEAAGSGIPNIKLVLRGETVLHDLRVLWVKFLGGVLAIGAGLGLGREGPTVQMGSSVAAWLGRRWKRSSGDDRDSLLICGGAAGLAAAFNAPLAGVLFALEELQTRFSHSILFAATVACLTADVVTRSILGEATTFDFPAIPPTPLANLPHCAVVGLAGGLVGIAFTRGLLSTQKFLQTSRRRLFAAVLLAAVAIVVAGSLAPNSVGSGLHLIDDLFRGRLSFALLLVLFAFRFALTVGCYGLGTAGGIFTPMLLVGGLMGTALGESAALVGIGGCPAAVWATAGMAAIFGSVVRCPLTGIVLLIEMTGQYTLVMPLMVAAFVGAGVADFGRVVPVYDALAAEPKA